MSEPATPAPGVETVDLGDAHDHRRALGLRGRGLPLLEAFNDAGVLTAADVHVARTLARVARESEEGPALAAAFATRAVRLGHVAVDLAALGGGELPWPDADAWLESTSASRLVRQGALVVDGGLVYLQRYHHQEGEVVRRLRERAAQAPPVVDETHLAQGLSRYFGPGDDEQRAAAETVARSWTSVVTGGPGTGKTTTVAKVLALLAAQASDGAPLRIGLAAPTGKAAARMQEALLGALEGDGQHPGVIALAPPQARPRVEALREVEAVTLHRLLGSRPDSRTRFRHHEGNRLPHDVVLVDEASMVSLTQTARLLEALRPTARLVLMGDPDQLVSVDAGAVLADLVAGAEAASDGAAADARTTAPVAIARLTRTHRFAAGSDIDEAARALRAGDADAVVELLRTAPGGQLTWDESPEPQASLHALLLRHARQVWARAREGDADGALAAMAEHRLLCAHRRGPFGARTWNRRIEGWLSEATGDPLYEPMYVGRPLIVTANDYVTGVYNGDTGVVVAARTAQGRPTRQAVIQGSTGLQRLGPGRLGDVDTLHAMTIHKAQGSQAREVTVLLPGEDSPLLTRELLYTAITRAREHVRVVGSEGAVRAAVARRVVRASGLRQRLVR